jgi:MarR family transcriptional regulator, organic hydroperoxide resistance regulator
MPFKVEDCIFFQLAKASQMGTRFWAGFVAKLGITPAQAMVLNFLGQGDEVTSRALGRRTSLDSATLTGILDRLETAGLIERRRHPADRRAIHICLTATGHKISDELYNMVIEANTEFLATLTTQEQQTLKSLLGKIHYSLLERDIIISK